MKYDMWRQRKKLPGRGKNVGQKLNIIKHSGVCMILYKGLLYFVYRFYKNEIKNTIKTASNGQILFVNRVQRTLISIGSIIKSFNLI